MNKYPNYSRKSDLNAFLQKTRIAKIPLIVKKKITVDSEGEPNYFFFDLAFLVAFLALGCFIPHAILCHLLRPFVDIDLFIPFNLIFVKSFLREL